MISHFWLRFLFLLKFLIESPLFYGNFCTALIWGSLNSLRTDSVLSYPRTPTLWAASFDLQERLSPQNKVSWGIVRRYIGSISTDCGNVTSWQCFLSLQWRHIGGENTVRVVRMPHNSQGVLLLPKVFLPLFR